MPQARVVSVVLVCWSSWSCPVYVSGKHHFVLERMLTVFTTNRRDDGVESITY